jgi:hypothetical protein
MPAAALPQALVWISRRRPSTGSVNKPISAPEYPYGTPRDAAACDLYGYTVECVRRINPKRLRKCLILLVRYCAFHDASIASKTALNLLI